MKVLKSEDRENVLDYVNEQMDRQPLKPRLESSDPKPHVNEPVAKRVKLDVVCEFDDDDQDALEESEVKQYMSASVPAHILKWWKDNSSIYPSLSRVARNILCVMATSAASERNFSLAGHVVS